MLSLLQFNIVMLQLFNICLFPSCSCVILAGKKFSPYFACFAASLCQSHTGQVVIHLWIFRSGPVKYESQQTATVNYARRIFGHHCDFEEWKPVRYESQRQWNFVSRKLGVATVYLCLLSTLLKLLFYGTGGLSISIYSSYCFWPSLRKGCTFTWTPIDRAQSDRWP